MHWHVYMYCRFKWNIWKYMYTYIQIPYWLIVRCCTSMDTSWWQGVGLGWQSHHGHQAAQNCWIWANGLELVPKCCVLLGHVVSCCVHFCLKAFSKNGARYALSYMTRNSNWRQNMQQEPWSTFQALGVASGGPSGRTCVRMALCRFDHSYADDDCYFVHFVSSN